MVLRCLQKMIKLETREATRKTLTSWFQKHTGLAVKIGSSGYLPECALLLTFLVRAYNHVFLQETEDLYMKEALKNTF